MAKHRQIWRELTHSEKMKYAQAMRRLNLGIWGYPLSTLRAIHLTTREGNDNTTKVFSRDLRKLIVWFRGMGFDIQYCGVLEFTPGKHLLHFHGLVRIKGGYFPVSRRMLGDKWNEIHGAFVVKKTGINNHKKLREYILKHIMKEYLGEDAQIRNKFLFSKGWMRSGWQEVQGVAKGWATGGLGGLYMDKKKWSLVNEIMLAWAEKQNHMFTGKIVDRKRVGYLYMAMGRIREAVGGAFEAGSYEYYDI